MLVIFVIQVVQKKTIIKMFVIKIKCVCYQNNDMHRKKYIFGIKYVCCVYFR